jgi:hypothetical protein
MSAALFNGLISLLEYVVLAKVFLSSRPRYDPYPDMASHNAFRGTQKKHRSLGLARWVQILNAVGKRQVAKDHSICDLYGIYDDRLLTKLHAQSSATAIF